MASTKTRGRRPPSKQSAGTLLYRRVEGARDAIEVLIVHPSGGYNRRAPWSIPKGMPEAGEALEEAARRETLEETGVAAAALVPLGYIDYSKSRKRIHAWGGEAPAEASPRCASWEVDRSEFVDVSTARTRLHPEQVPFVDRLLEHLGGGCVAGEPPIS